MSHPLLLLTMLLSLWLSPPQALNEYSTLKDEMMWLHERFDVNFIYDSSMDLDVPYVGKPMSEVAETDGSDEDKIPICLETLFSATGIDWEINRKYIVLVKGRKKPKDYTVFVEPQHDTLDEACITAIIDLRRNSTQTGLERIDGSRFRRSYAALSAPDVIKSLQELPGVSAGTEMLSGLYVRGGTGSDNLFNLDGVPLWGISHLGGLYSSFNTEVAEAVDFYKSGFPARYGGRLSSVVDMSVRDGSMTEYKGCFTAGLINGVFQMEGPLVRERTSFNVALRRSWLDLLSIPGFALYNKFKDDEDPELGVRYALTDMNAKLTHKLKDDSYLRLNVYTGRDAFIYSMDFDQGVMPPDWYYEHEKYSLNWGNILGSLSWNKVFGNGIRSDIKLYYTGYRSVMDWDKYSSSQKRMDERFRSVVHDVGVKADFDHQVNRIHRLRYGADCKMYVFAPESVWNYYEETDANLTEEGCDSADYLGKELSVYVEDEMALTDWLSASSGLRGVLFGMSGKSYLRLEPRVAVCMDATESASFRLSYTEMNQFSHSLVTSYIDLPTNIWMPSTADIPPMNSRQIAAGAYFSLPASLSLETEVFYKTMNQIREYKGWSIFPDIENWEDSFLEGKGRSYGFEAGLVYNTIRTHASVYYTLSKSERFFSLIYPVWFPDHFDNRHRLNLSVNHRFGKKFEMYVGWIWHTGNRITGKSQQTGSNEYLYTSPNNLLMPDYHRLDLGFNFYRTTKRGNESVWNLSIYNLYCRMNAIYVYPYINKGNTYTALGILPVIPSFSYTLRF